jgi:hypothetical protein
MDGSGAQGVNIGRPQGAPHQQQASLIRPEQVARLPQLNPGQKQTYQAAVTKCWDILNNLPQSDPKYTNAYQALVQTSQTLMQGMKNYQQANRQRNLLQQQQQVAQNTAPTGPIQAGQAGQAGQQQPQQQQQPGSNNSLSFNQLHAEVQQKVNDQHFYYPPAMMEGTKQAEEWLREAKARYGQALQRLHIARNKKQEFEKQARARQQAGNPLTTEEQQIFTSKVAQCNKAITESQTFMEKFKQQQNDFRNAISSQQYTKQPGQEGQPHPQSAPGMTLQPGMQAQHDGPQAHSISSAVSAAASARNRQQQDQTATQATVPAQTGPSGSPVNPNGAAAQPGVTPVKPDPNPNVFPTSTHPDAPNSAGPHRPASHAGMPQSALTQHPSSQSLHAHPLSASINGAKPVTAQAITKNLQVTEPKPVQMPPARPTLNGGASVGMAGSLGQPAITTLPGYVLESSEDGRMMSKKKLNELIREVVGLGKEGSEEESSMTTEAEEVRLPTPIQYMY